MTLKTEPVGTTAETLSRTVVRRFELHGEQAQIEACYGIVTCAPTLADCVARPYFSLTGSLWLPTPAGRYRQEPNSCGQITEEILAAFPWLSLMAMMHLRDAVTGEPLHAVANGWFWYSANKQERRGREVSFPAGWAEMSRAQRAASYLDVDPALLEDLESREDLDRRLDAVRPAWAAMATNTRVIYGLGE